MITSLFKHERIKTTITKAKAVSRQAEHLISQAQQNTLAARRHVAVVVKDQAVLKKLFEVIVPRMKDKKSGFITIVRLWPRHGDAALMAQMELFGAPAKTKAEEPKKEAKKQPAFKKKAEKKPEGSEEKKAPKAKKEKPAKKEEK
jgi:large subunit ribosomal protein L17